MKWLEGGTSDCCCCCKLCMLPFVNPPRLNRLFVHWTGHSPGLAAAAELSSSSASRLLLLRCVRTRMRFWRSSDPSRACTQHGTARHSMGEDRRRTWHGMRYHVNHNMPQHNCDVWQTASAWHSMVQQPS